jgi:hypothetical protein
MPWKTPTPMEQRHELVLLAKSGEFTVTELCKRFAISRNVPQNVPQGHVPQGQVNRSPQAFQRDTFHRDRSIVHQDTFTGTRSQGQVKHRSHDHRLVWNEARFCFLQDRDKNLGGNSLFRSAERIATEKRHLKRKWKARVRFEDCKSQERVAIHKPRRQSLSIP